MEYMNRRTLLKTLPVAAVTSGCLSSPGSESSSRSTESTTSVTASAVVHTSQQNLISAKITSVTFDKPYRTDDPSPPRDEDGDYVETVSSDYKCEKNTIIFTGWFFSQTCRSIQVKSIDYSHADEEMRVVLHDKWTSSGSPSQGSCSGIKYQYRLKLTSEQPITKNIRIIHDKKPTNSENQFRFSNSC